MTTHGYGKLHWQQQARQEDESIKTLSSMFMSSKQGDQVWLHLHFHSIQDEDLVRNEHLGSDMDAVTTMYDHWLNTDSLNNETYLLLSAPLESQRISTYLRNDPLSMTSSSLSVLDYGIVVSLKQDLRRAMGTSKLIIHITSSISYCRGIR